MNRAHIEQVGGKLVALGVATSWQSNTVKPRKVRTKAALRTVEFNSSQAGYIVPQKVKETVYSLAVLVARSSTNALYLLEEEDRFWYVFIKDGDIQPGSDCFYSLEDSEDIRSRLSEARNLIGSERIYQYSSMFDLLGAIDVSDLALNDAKLSVKKGVGSIALFAVLVFVLTGLFVAYKKFDRQAVNSDSEILKVQNATQSYNSSLGEFQQSISSKSVMAYVERALTIPTNKFGFKLSSISCDYFNCVITYSSKDAFIISDALEWARTVDHTATFDRMNGALVLNRFIDTAHVPPVIPKREPEKAILNWADLTAIIKPLGITSSYSDLSLVSGAGVLGHTTKSGTWEVSSIGFGYALAIIEGLEKIPGVGMTYFRMSGDSVTLGGVYAIQ